MDLRSDESVALNLAKCWKHKNIHKHCRMQKRREAQSKRRYMYIMMSSELMLVHNIYYISVTTSLSKLHRKRQSEQKTTSWVTDLAQITYKSPSITIQHSSNNMYQLPWSEHHRPSKTCEAKHNTPYWKLLNNTSGWLWSQLYHESIGHVFTKDFYV